MGPALQPNILQGRARVLCRECGTSPPGRTAWWLVRRADVGIGPYEDVTSSVMQVRAAGLQEVR